MGYVTCQSIIPSHLLTYSQQLHFSNPETYHEIYNASNRWDKEESLYHSFGEDRSSFGYLTYTEAKPRKDILSRVFSKQAIRNAEYLILEKASKDEYCDVVSTLTMIRYWLYAIRS